MPADPAVITVSHVYRDGERWRYEISPPECAGVMQGTMQRGNRSRSAATANRNNTVSLMRRRYANSRILVTEELP